MRPTPSDSRSLSPSSTNPNQAVQSTDLDALLSRHSASTLSYLSDPYTTYFLPPSIRRAGPSGWRRPVLIHLGTHARTWGVDRGVERFLFGGGRTEGEGREGSGSGRGSGGEQVARSKLGRRGKRQVLSMGAGTDTRYWRMRDKWISEAAEGSRTLEGWEEVVNWVEVDFEEATSAKAKIVATKKELKDGVGHSLKIEKGGLALSSKAYKLIPGDLRNLTTSLGPYLLSSDPFPTRSEPLLDPTLPTLLLAECVLVYLPAESTTDLLRWFSSTFREAGGSCISYDPFNFEDAFGKVMIRNLATRNLVLPAASSTPTLESLNTRLKENGFAQAESRTIEQIRRDVIPQEEIQRVNKLEQIDEVEELNLVLGHYAITMGNVRGDEGVGF
ncbi:BZ3500_MvSof-1268-A1-R1_Chr1-1g00951 [Microbotryum saponariae]|uniref:Leucine carboxyl methyltransferase 1 n=1 Tax=Microbotryum saponariae TaxID=289078 RepID=A0A2X0MBA8_9BASI|nr:BZ3500_MvSof-1268-A1-R1_Chr1-1g00951 [Microbotryum saponariae]SCZ93012.1 BZ3501_MvSof-1269-A2-R1_Chr1-1g00548 [Microbotryum saponariae]